MGRDGQTGQFDEFAYVEFSSIEEADKVSFLYEFWWKHISFYNVNYSLLITSFSTF